MSGNIYRFKDGEIRTEQRPLGVVHIDGVIYGILGGVREGVEFDLAVEVGKDDGRGPSCTVVTKPGEPLKNVSLYEIARRPVSPGDNLVAVVLKGEVSYELIKQGSVVLLPQRVKEVVQAPPVEV